MLYRLVAVVLILGGTLVAQGLEFTERARTAVAQMARGEFASVVAQFDEKMRAALPEEKLRQVWASVVTQAGAYQRSTTPRVDVTGDLRIVTLPSVFAHNDADITIVYNGAGRIVGLNVRPAAAAGPFVDAAYIDGSRFTDREVTVGAEGWPLPGTLSMPATPFRPPAVVLVHGSGPGDRDQTVGPNKIFRDLAHGLASRGIAVLRFEKRTRQHAGRVSSIQPFTVKDETLDDAAAAVRWLQASPLIDQNRVFVLGHSLGGMLAPRLAEAATGLRGVIILAGAVRSLEQSIIDQTRYLADLDGTITAEEGQHLADVEQLAARAKTLKPGDPPLGVAGIGAPAWYWIDLRGYHPPTAARRVKQPMLILQGERDYQVTRADFAQWRTAVGARPDVTLKEYPALNHFFIAGSGPSVPAEYFTAGHVAEEVVRDIATWITALKSP